MLILASILPGNKVLLLADLPVAPFLSAGGHLVIHRGDLIRTSLSGIIVTRLLVLLSHPVRAKLYRYGAQRRL